MSRKGENIYRRKDGRWEARYIVGHAGNGKTMFRSVYAPTYTEAREKRKEALREYENAKEEIAAKTGTVAVIGEAWLADESHKWKESTRCRYREKFGLYVIPEYGERSLAGITTEEAESYIVKLQSEGLPGRKPVGTSTASLVLTVIKDIVKYARKHGFQTGLVPECISVKRDRSEITVFSEKDERRLVHSLKTDTDETGAGVLTCLFTGIRIGELCALNCDDIDLEQCVLHVRRTMQRLPVENGATKTAVRIDTPKSDCSVRDIPFNKGLADIIRPFHKPGAFLLTGDKVRFVEPRTMEIRFARLLDECGIGQVNFHVTRHTYATRCIERGMDAKTLSELLGHASVSTTLDRYVHLSMRHKAESVRLIEDLL